MEKDPTHDREEGTKSSADEVYPEYVTRNMQAALQQAERALEQGEVPVGCVFVHNGEVISSGYNLTTELKNGTMHAEIVSINKIIKEAVHDVSILRESDLYVTCEPCIMVRPPLPPFFHFILQPNLILLYNCLCSVPQRCPQ